RRLATGKKVYLRLVARDYKIQVVASFKSLQRGSDRNQCSPGEGFSRPNGCERIFQGRCDSHSARLVREGSQADSGCNRPAGEGLRRVRGNGTGPPTVVARA